MIIQICLLTAIHCILSLEFTKYLLLNNLVSLMLWECKVISHTLGGKLDVGSFFLFVFPPFWHFLAGRNLKPNPIWFLCDYLFLPGLGYMLAWFFTLSSPNWYGNLIWLISLGELAKFIFYLVWEQKVSWETCLETMQQLILDFHCNHLLVKSNYLAEVISHIQWSLECILWLCHNIQVCTSVTVSKFTP